MTRVKVVHPGDRCSGGHGRVVHFTKVLSRMGGGLGGLGHKLPRTGDGNSGPRTGDGVFGLKHMVKRRKLRTLRAGGLGGLGVSDSMHLAGLLGLSTKSVRETMALSEISIKEEESALGDGGRLTKVEAKTMETKLHDVIEGVAKDPQLLAGLANTPALTNLLFGSNVAKVKMVTLPNNQVVITPINEPIATTVKKAEAAETEMKKPGVWNKIKKYATSVWSGLKTAFTYAKHGLVTLTAWIQSNMPFLAKILAYALSIKRALCQLLSSALEVRIFKRSLPWTYKLSKFLNKWIVKPTNVMMPVLLNTFTEYLDNYTKAFESAIATGSSAALTAALAFVFPAVAVQAGAALNTVATYIMPYASKALKGLLFARDLNAFILGKCIEIEVVLTDNPQEVTHVIGDCKGETKLPTKAPSKAPSKAPAKVPSKTNVEVASGGSEGSGGSGESGSCYSKEMNLRSQQARIVCFFKIPEAVTQNLGSSYDPAKAVAERLFPNNMVQMSLDDLAQTMAIPAFLIDSEEDSYKLLRCEMESKSTTLSNRAYEAYYTLKSMIALKEQSEETSLSFSFRKGIHWAANEDSVQKSMDLVAFVEGEVLQGRTREWEWEKEWIDKYEVAATATAKYAKEKNQAVAMLVESPMLKLRNEARDMLEKENKIRGVGSQTPKQQMLERLVDSATEFLLAKDIPTFPIETKAKATEAIQRLREGFEGNNTWCLTGDQKVLQSLQDVDTADALEMYTDLKALLDSRQGWIMGSCGAGNEKLGTSKPSLDAYLRCTDPSKKTKAEIETLMKEIAPFTRWRMYKRFWNDLRKESGTKTGGGSRNRFAVDEPRAGALPGSGPGSRNGFAVDEPWVRPLADKDPGTRGSNLNKPIRRSNALRR